MEVIIYGTKKSILYVFLSAIMFSIGGILIKIIPWSAFTINGVRNVFAALVTYIYFKKQGHKFKFDKNILWGSLSYAITQISLVVAVKLTTAANAIAIQFSAPIFIILFSWLLFHERPRKLDVITSIIVSIGIICFFLDGLTLGQNLGNFVALISGITYAFIFMLKSLSDDTISPVFWGQLICIVAGAPLIFFETTFTPTAVISVIILGVVQIGLAFIFLLKGIEYVPAITSSLISTVEPILNPIWVAIFYGETISPMSFLGATIVIASIAIYNILKLRTRTLS